MRHLFSLRSLAWRWRSESVARRAAQIGKMAPGLAENCERLIAARESLTRIAKSVFPAMRDSIPAEQISDRELGDSSQAGAALTID